MALPRFQAADYATAWQLVGNALPGTFAVRSIGIWLQELYGATLDLQAILRGLVNHTQLDFAGSTPRDLVQQWRTAADAHQRTPVAQARARPDTTPHPSHVASQGFGRLIPGS